MARKIEISEAPITCAVEDMIYVAVGNDMKGCKGILVWALQNSGGRRICILHVHQPAQLIPFMGARAPASSLQEMIVREYWETERQSIYKTLDDYLLICRQTGVEASKIVIEMDCIEKGIVELVSQQGIRKLVMGAAAEKHYNRKMMDLKSGKAKYVRQHAHVSCQVQFICKGFLIFTREASADNETGEFNNKRSRSVAVRPSRNIFGIGPSNYWRSKSDTVDKTRSSSGTSKLNTPFPEGTESSPFPKSTLEIVGSSDERGGLPGSPSNLHGSTCSPSGGFDITMAPLKDEENELTFSIHSPALGYARSPWTVKTSSPFMQPSPTLTSGASSLSASSSNGALNSVDGSLDVNTLHAKLQEAEQEMLRHQKAKRDLIEALYRAQDELIQRKTEEASAKATELEEMKIQSDQLMEVLRFSREQEISLKSQIGDLKKVNDELREERDNARKEADGLRRKREGSTGDIPQFFEFSLSDIEEATQGFNENRKIGEGGYGSIYKGILHQTQVAIKRLHPQRVYSDGVQGPSEFQTEVHVLNQLRHPNLVNLIGSCPEAFALIYEYIPNGSLEDRLYCKNNSPPLSWQTRIRIATELCAVLIYLHSKPHSIVHGDLKPSNILLGANFESKLSDFGISRLLGNDKDLTNKTLCHVTNPKGTVAYIDPEFLETGVLTLKSDVYSFGVILLQLLTRKAPFLIANEVKGYLDNGNLQSILDPLAGDWPITCALELARLGLSCCDKKRKRRPELKPDVCNVLESMNALSAASSSSQLHLED